MQSENEKKSAVSRIKENPVIVILTVIITFGASISAGLNISGWYDSQHTTEAELSIAVSEAQHQRQELGNKLEQQTKRQTCESLAIRINIVENQIWQMEQVEPPTQRLTEKKRELRDLEDKYADLKCASILR